eukprot:scaffold20903_cov99-Isochrysis_galbana.AAC.11
MSSSSLSTPSATTVARLAGAIVKAAKIWAAPPRTAGKPRASRLAAGRRPAWSRSAAVSSAEHSEAASRAAEACTSASSEAITAISGGMMPRSHSVVGTSTPWTAMQRRMDRQLRRSAEDASASPSTRSSGIPPSSSRICRDATQSCGHLGRCPIQDLREGGAQTAQLRCDVLFRLDRPPRESDRLGRHRQPAARAAYQ